MCLSLLGTNKVDSLKTAHRICYLIEPTRRWTEDVSEANSSPEPAKLLLDLVLETGFGTICSEIRDEDRYRQFTFLHLFTFQMPTLFL